MGCKMTASSGAVQFSPYAGEEKPGSGPEGGHSRDDALPATCTEHPISQIAPQCKRHIWLQSWNSGARAKQGLLHAQPVAQSSV